MRRFIYKILIAFAFLPLILPFNGCIEDDLSVCGVSVNFEFTKNVEDIDKFATNVDKINLYVFDSEGMYMGEYEEEGNRLHSGPMKLNLMAGTYSLVAWGNLCDDYELPSFGIGTGIDDVILSLKRNQDTVRTHPGDLYHGLVKDIVIEPSLQSNQSITISLTKNTNNIKVVALNLPISKAAGTMYDCTINSINGDYNFDNSIAGINRLQYIPEASINNENQLISDFVVMRELNDGSTRSRLLFTRNQSGNNPETLVDLNLIEYLIPASITKDLDRDDNFLIELTFDDTYGTVSIKVNGWEYPEVDYGSILYE